MKGEHAEETEREARGWSRRPPEGMGAPVEEAVSAYEELDTADGEGDGDRKRVIAADVVGTEEVVAHDGEEHEREDGKENDESEKAGQEGRPLSVGEGSRMKQGEMKSCNHTYTNIHTH